MQTKRIHLAHELSLLCQRNKDGSFSTQAARKRILYQAAMQLKALGVYNLSPQGLKPRHIEKLVGLWLAEGLSAGTLKNRMSHLRWWAEKIGKPAIIHRDNTAYGIDRRKYVTNISKARELDAEKLAKVNDTRIRCSLELQAAFGLRREECLKFSPSVADKGDSIVLKASWTKGGKARTIPVRTAKQRALLDRVHQLVGKGSMIPPDKQYVEQLHRYEGMTKAAGLSKMHGLRHAYAQARYLELTGRAAPACGGRVSRALTVEEKQQDNEVRLIISKELGHERESVTAVYLGR